MCLCLLLLFGLSCALLSCFLSVVLRGSCLFVCVVVCLFLLFVLCCVVYLTSIVVIWGVLLLSCSFCVNYVISMRVFVW